METSGGQIDGKRKAGRTEKTGKLRIRHLPRGFCFAGAIMLIILFFFTGAMIGYGVIGDGNPFDVFKLSTWRHIYDIVNKGT
mgnify:CR=1 FL=1